MFFVTFITGVEPTFRLVAFWTNIYYEIRVAPIKSFRGGETFADQFKNNFIGLNHIRGYFDIKKYTHFHIKIDSNIGKTNKSVEKKRAKS